MVRNVVELNVFKVGCQDFKNNEGSIGTRGKSHKPYETTEKRHRRNTFCDVTAPGQRYLSLFDRMKEIASFAASPLARVYETLRPCLSWNFTSSLRLSETSFL